MTGAPLRRLFSLTPEAAADIAEIARWTTETFGERQSIAYRDAIGDLIRRIAVDQDDPAVKPRPELGEGVRSVHLRAMASRARHSIYFRACEAGLSVLRVLHDRMEPSRHLPSASDDP